SWDNDELYYGIWANIYDVMPDYLGKLEVDYGFLKVYDGGLEYEGWYIVACISLADDSDNNALIELATDYIVDVTLTDRTLYKDNAWQTLCLPFSLDDFTGIVENLKQACIQDPSYKLKAKKDVEFKKYWDAVEFRDALRGIEEY
ncbi:MAG: hypothetical protein J6T33_07080, partial [Bacteroidales bacterium]|nr:hypothetical protein [Bacteroidales bacterium]